MSREKNSAVNGAEGMPPAVWLEHLEEEMEAQCRAEEAADKDLLLKNSPADLETYEALKRVRATVKSTDDVAMPESGHYYDQLHAKIMAAIDAEIESAPSRPKQRRALRLPFAWPTAFRAAGLTMMIALISWLGLHQKGSLSTAGSMESTIAVQSAGESFERNVASTESHSGAEFAHDMGSFEGDEDFVTEAAEARLAQVSQHDADAMLKSLKM